MRRRAGIAALAAVFALAGTAVPVAEGVSPVKDALLGGGSIEA